jgi:O-antigen/teichoic acid export membrane protein
MDVAIIGFFLTQVDVGAYQVAWQVATLLLFMSRAIGRVVFPQISQWVEEGKSEEISVIVSRSIPLTLLLIVPGFVGSLWVSKDILRLVFGQEFTIASIALVIIMGERTLQSVHVVLAQTLKGLDRPDLAAYPTLLAISLNLFLNVLLIPEFGITGAAIATTSAFTVNTIIHWHFVTSLLGVRFPIKKSGWCFIASTIMGVFVWVVRSVIYPESIFGLALIIGSGAIVYAVIVPLYTPLRNDLQHYVRSILSPDKA